MMGTLIVGLAHLGSLHVVPHTPATGTAGEQVQHVVASHGEECSTSANGGHADCSPVDAVLPLSPTHVVASRSAMRLQCTDAQKATPFAEAPYRPPAPTTTTV